MYVVCVCVMCSCSCDIQRSMSGVFLYCSIASSVVLLFKAGSRDEPGAHGFSSSCSESPSDPLISTVPVVGL